MKLAGVHLAMERNIEAGVLISGGNIPRLLDDYLRSIIATKVISPIRRGNPLMVAFAKHQQVFGGLSICIMSALRVQVSPTSCNHPQFIEE
jgi:hypothetical protein